MPRPTEPADLTPGYAPVSPADVLLADGHVAVIRPLRHQDMPAVKSLHDRVSERALRLRFFSTGRRAAQDYVTHLAASDAILALVSEMNGSIVALATAETIGPGTAEVSFLVDDSLHGVGLGSLLLEHLAAAGRDSGITRFTAEVLVGNSSMLAVLMDAGFTIRRRTDAGVVHVDLDTAATASAVEAADAREEQAEQRSLKPLLYPRAVAVLGVRRNRTGIGAAVLESIKRGGFTGHLYVVHPDVDQVADVPAFSSLAHVPKPVDLAVLAVPAARTVDAMRDAVAAGVRAVVVISSGFQELGEVGAGFQRELFTLARTHSIRLVGPNCLGILSNDPGVRLNATFSPTVPRPGGLAVASQSGGVGIALLDIAQRTGIGVRAFVSLGNKADVSSNDLLAAWRADPGVTAAALYLESFGNALKFARVARRFAECKPLIAVVGGRSTGGRRAGASHTAAALTSQVGLDALFAQAGVVPCDSAEDMAETALVLTEQPLPRGRRVGILSNAGGMGVLAADEAEGAGLAVPQLSETLRARFRSLVQSTTGTTNPVDAGAGVPPRDFGAVAAELLASDEIDALVVVLVATSVTDVPSILRSLAEVRSQLPTKPLLLVPLGGPEVPPGSIPGITSLRTSLAALRTLARARKYSEWLETPRRAPEPTDRHRMNAVREVAEKLMQKLPGREGWLDPSAMEQLLGPYGLTPTGRLATNGADAARVAAALGFPVAVKIARNDIVHKTDRGLVRVGLGSPAEVEAAVRSFAQEVGDNQAVLVQPVLKGLEMAVGLVEDPVFGPMIMVGAGGVGIDVWDDRTFLLPPVTATDAIRALHSLRIWPLLAGFRGSPPTDVDSLVEVVVAVANLGADLPALAELDLNPVLVAPDGCHLVDVKVRLAPMERIPTGVPRQLRRPRLEA